VPKKICNLGLKEMQEYNGYNLCSSPDIIWVTELVRKKSALSWYFAVHTGLPTFRDNILPLSSTSFQSRVRYCSC
jgi:hypothetical protein